jgi:hypothetical protein
MLLALFLFLLYWCWPVTGGQGFIREQCMGNLWCTEWHLDRFSFVYLVLSESCLDLSPLNAGILATVVLVLK